MIYLLFLIVSTDQWSPVNPQGKKTYGRNFLLELQNSPACQKKPHGLASLEIVRDKVRKRISRDLIKIKYEMSANLFYYNL